MGLFACVENLQIAQQHQALTAITLKIILMNRYLLEAVGSALKISPILLFSPC